MQNRYGVDVAARRADDLDKKMIAYVGAHNRCSVLDLGAGSGGQSVRMAEAGAQVTAVDIGICEPFLKHEDVTFVLGDIRNIAFLTGDAVYDICCFQRTLHYLAYDEALALLIYLKKHITKKLFVSVTGIESDIGLHYAHTHKPVTERFSPLSQTDAETFSITQPVCLYTPEEFIMLLQAAGWEIEACWVSAFGNIKAVCYV
jgi:SAM-dependent methyltransferase